MNSEFIDFYKVLEVQYGASDDEIKKSYRRLMKKYHPDINPTAGDKPAKELNEAYEILSTKAKRAEYDIKYQLHLIQEEEKARRAQEQAARTAQKTQYARDTKTKNYTNQSKTTASEENYANSTENKSYNYQRTTTTEQSRVKTKPGFFQQIKNDWNEIRKEEKRYPFFKRHKSIERNIYKSYSAEGFDTDTISFKLKKGTLHVAGELLYQLEKLSHITEDTIPKFVIRNRGTIAASIALGLLFSSFGGKTDKPEMPVQPLVTTGTYSEADLPSDTIIEEEQTSEDKNNQTYTVYRDYTIEFGDTLSELAEDANCSVEELQRLNGLSSSMIRSDNQLLIPYHIESGDLKYATDSVYYPTDMDLETFAARYETTVESIKTLNSEAIEDGQIISDTLLVPTFATTSEIKEAKSLENTTQYHK